MPGPRRPRVETGFDEISPEDIIAFAEFLDREPLAKRSMSIAMLDGFLTAIVIGPEVVMPSDYLPWIWDWKCRKYRKHQRRRWRHRTVDMITVAALYPGLACSPCASAGRRLMS